MLLRVKGLVGQEICVEHYAKFGRGVSKEVVEVNGRYGVRIKTMDLSFRLLNVSEQWFQHNGHGNEMEKLVKMAWC
ncbi:hypothetical protein KY289_020132 [Solanum tuberosum]|nr:hypothetical protein KY289_020132 [Solanum tuberosum]